MRRNKSISKFQESIYFKDKKSSTGKSRKHFIQTFLSFTFDQESKTRSTRLSFLHLIGHLYYSQELILKKKT